MKLQMTLWIDENLESQIKKTATNLQTNRQGAISHILQMYYKKEYLLDSAKQLA